ncbi:hypothetical protein KKC00_00860 [Patescibacteria group bacterium]|nr:hypothetical protein [Patescibacteria group bacterium]
MKRFAFIVHLRDLNDIAHVIPFVPNALITKVLRHPILWLLSHLRGRFGFMIRSRFPVNKEVEGHIIVIWLTGSQIMSGNAFARKRILEAVLYAQNKLECNIIGLGALTASITRAGQWLVEQPGIKSMITHGDSYAVALALEGIFKIADGKKINLAQSTVAIVGATGIIGEALSRVLSDKVGELILVGRRIERLKEVEDAVRQGNAIIVTTMNLKDIVRADIVITATSSPDALISIDYLKEGAIVYEVAQPRNVSKMVAEQRSDIMVIDGCYAKVPESIIFWWMSLPPHCTFGCMAETMLLTMNGSLESHRVGRIDLGFVKNIKELGQKYGFGHAEFSSFNKKLC